MAAIDLDGTLLGPDGHISPENAGAVRRLQAAGVQVVLASGRHYQNMRRHAEALPGVEWLISCQGGELCNLSRTEILAAAFLPGPRVKEALDLGASLGFSTVAYGIEGVLTTSDWNADLDLYSRLAGRRPSSGPARKILDRQIFKIIWMGEPKDIERALQQSRINPAVFQMVRTHARLVELMPVDVSKASALKIIAARLGVKSAESIAFGDGDNDVPMFDWAGVSVAMAHGWPGALRAATYTTPAGPTDTALARAIDLLFDNNLLPSPHASPHASPDCAATALAA